MRKIEFRVWYRKESKMYYRGYQKLAHVLLCEDDGASGKPVRRVSYNDCDFMEFTGLKDIRDKEIFEGDRVRVKVNGKIFEGMVEDIPDMFKSRGLHPLHSLLEKNGISDKTEKMEIEVLGNKYE